MAYDGAIWSNIGDNNHASIIIIFNKIVWVNDENKSYMSHLPNGISKLLQIIFNLSHILILCLLLLLV